jgi:uncharacterized protein YdhG (YjbR/CyaY superfamily)
MTVDEYIAAQPPERRGALHDLRRVVLEAVPDATESISYGMPTYRLPNGHPVYFAGWTHHVSLHDIPRLDPDLEREVGPYRSGKDTLKFANAERIPFDLVARLVVAISNRSA